MQQNNLISGILAILVIGTLCVVAVYQVVKGVTVVVPPFLEGVAGVIIGYFFSHQAATSAATTIVNGLAASHPAAVPGQVTTTTNPSTQQSSGPSA